MNKFPLVADSVFQTLNFSSHHNEKLLFFKRCYFCPSHTAVILQLVNKNTYFFVTQQQKQFCVIKLPKPLPIGQSRHMVRFNLSCNRPHLWACQRTPRLWPTTEWTPVNCSHWHSLAAGQKPFKHFGSTFTFLYRCIPAFEDQTLRCFPV